MELLVKTSDVFVVSGREIPFRPSYLPLLLTFFNVLLTRNMKYAIFILLSHRGLRTLSLLSNMLMTQLLSCKVVTHSLLF
jgi:hypothetical protein